MYARFLSGDVAITGAGGGKGGGGRASAAPRGGRVRNAIRRVVNRFRGGR